MNELRIVNISHLDYGDGLQMMRDLVKLKREKQTRDVLIVTEHESVLTMGRQGTEEDILISGERLAALGLQVHAIERGGLVTYHGPGILMAYPVFDLKRMGIGVADFVHLLEDIILATLRTYGVRAQKKKEHPGVWVETAKIASIGLAVKGGISMHGVALNCQPDLAMFGIINPCGMKGMQQTSISAILGCPVDSDKVREEIISQFGQHLGLDSRTWDFEQVRVASGMHRQHAAFKDIYN